MTLLAPHPDPIADEACAVLAVLLAFGGSQIVTVRRSVQDEVERLVRERDGVKRLGHLHYQRRALSSWCDPTVTQGPCRGGCEGCQFAFLSKGDYLITLCTCSCHPLNRAQEVLAS
ncbi:MAG: hypothetical protein LC798_03195 [Chloroflexi bacterium]|nr:hypothetical protein [Chloroflexota bacterium]